MFQFFKRAQFISRNNFVHLDMGNLVNMHLWLQEHGWPANQLVDLFMRCDTNWNEALDGLSFKMFMCDQYEWVRNDDVEALRRLGALMHTPQYRGVDNDNIVNWVCEIVEGLKDRDPTPLSKSTGTLQPTTTSTSNGETYQAICIVCGKTLPGIGNGTCGECRRVEAKSQLSTQVSGSSDYLDKTKALDNISASDRCNWPDCARPANARLYGKPYCFGHYWESKAQAKSPGAAWPFPTGSRPK